MTRIMFVCLGNICRSPMAEFIMKDIVKKAGLSEEYFIDSAATCSDELGNPVYPPVRAVLNERGLSCRGKTAKQLSASDYEKYDYFIGMDQGNRRSMLRLFNGDPAGKVSLLLDYTDHPRDVADPWYSERFDVAYRDIYEGCTALLDAILKQDKQ